PFMDVPASHWAYDAVAQLASRGIVSGYPDGTFKGPQPATRYEIASVIARALAYADMEHASKQDVEMLKRLIVEFSDELNALGVAVDNLDARLGTLDADLGGWKLSGVFEFNAKFGSDDGRLNSYEIGDYNPSTGMEDWIKTGSGPHNFDLDKYRIFLDKRINETTSFHARLGKSDGLSNSDPDVRWNYYYVSIVLGYDVIMDVGRFGTNFEDDLGLVGDDAAYIGDVTRNGMRFSKDWGMASLKLLIARTGDDFGPTAAWYDEEAFLFGANLDFHFNEKFQAGVFAYYLASDVAESYDTELSAAIYAKFRFHPSVELKGVYYFQDGADRDSANAWKVILAADQDLLKFTSLQLEYAQIGNDFRLWNDPYANMDFGWGNAYWADGTTTVYGVKAAQKWGDTKWDSWLRFYHADFDTVGLNDVNQVGLGIGYQYNPAVHFELAVDWVDDGGSDDTLVRFQTVVNF
ncbi:MAG: S-layer homology domain-containing protein, partial [Synergistaceae bacterium]|nr:S-layer homology domain-containing protein [Synergistaceae bacterium]